MNTEAIRAAAEVIHAAEMKSTVPVTLAIALDHAGWLNTPETADELRTLRARVAELRAEPPTPLPDAECLVCGEGLDDENITEFCSDRCQTTQACQCRTDRGGDRNGWIKYRGRDGEFVELRCRDHAMGATQPVEDPHDSPLHHTYRVGRDFPEVPRG